MSEYLLDIDVVLEEEEEDERDTLEMPEENLKVLIAKSTPPPRLVDSDQFAVSLPAREERISITRPFMLATPWVPHQ
jgi:hypothetical protein